MIFLRRAKKYMIQKSFDIPFHDKIIYQINHVLNGYIVNIGGDIEYYYNVSLEKYINHWNKAYSSIINNEQKYDYKCIIPVTVKKQMEAITDESYLYFIHDIMYRYCLTIPLIRKPHMWELDFKNATISLSKIKLL